MPLRDHFRPPVSRHVSWEELHGGWPMVIVQQLRGVLPPGYAAGPRVHLGAQVEVDVSTYERDDSPPDASAGGATATAWAPARPSVAVETELPEYDEYAVRVYDAERGRTLVAAVEIVSPANKDRPEKRNAFVGKCAALLEKGVAVTIVDLVTVRHANLYAELMAFVGHADADPVCGDPPGVYAACCRWVPRGGKYVLETWSHALAVGSPLPTLPLWLSAGRSVPLDLERSYEQACQDLWFA